MNSKKKFWFSLISLALVVVIGLSAVGLILAALSANFDSSFRITYTAKHVGANITGLKCKNHILLRELTADDFTSFGEISFQESDTLSTKSLPSLDLEAVDMQNENLDDIMGNLIAYQIENTGKNGFGISSTLTGIDEKSNISVEYYILDFNITESWGAGGTRDVYQIYDISNICIYPGESITFAVRFVIKDINIGVNASGNFNFVLDGDTEETLCLGYKLNEKIKGGNGSNVTTADSTVQNLTFDRYTSEGKYEVAGVDKIAGVEGVDVGGGAMLYRVPNADKFDVYILSDKTIYCNSLSGHMFQKLIMLENIILNNFDTSKVHDMSCMFILDLGLKSCTGIENFNTRNVSSMEGLFIGCGLSTLNLNGWETDNVKNMSYIFYTCLLFSTIDLSNWNTSNVTDMRQMFHNCSQLQTIYVGDGWNTQNVSSSGYMFYSCRSLVGGNAANPTHYDENHIDKEYARVDGENGLPGYLSRKSA